MLSNTPPTSDHATTRFAPPVASESRTTAAPGRRSTGCGLRRATPGERSPALKIALGCDRLAEDEAVAAFTQYAAAHGVDLREIRIPGHRGPLQAALMPVTASGRTCLVLCPSRLGRSVTREAWREAISDIMQSQEARGTRLIQVLLAPGQGSDAVAGIFAAEGFGEVATLSYLYRRADKRIRPEPPRPGMHLIAFSEASRPLFEQAIAASYIASRDCPSLHKARTIDEVIEGHMGAGEFRSGWWQVLVDEDGEGGRSPLGVLLLAGIGEDAAGGLELVYVGIDAAARGRGLARYLIEVAVDAAARARGRGLTLAVDDRNAPAVALYESSGFVRVQRRRVLGRDLVRQCALGEPVRPRVNA